ncbi:VOC family protein [Amycolatopsis sp. VS8301801F10]|uniref:VOC family protein n=1 Tax=Amycolatopsis sp. VS8301801F10 TaxID=2652442 RepID=UPI0038FCA393
MRTPHLGLRVTDLPRSLKFSSALGYEFVGTVPGTAIGQLTMLKLPGDEFVTVETFLADPDGRRIELVQWPAGHLDGMTAADWAGSGTGR